MNIKQVGARSHGTLRLKESRRRWRGSELAPGIGPTSTAKCLISNPNSGMVWIVGPNPRGERTGTASRQ